MYETDGNNKSENGTDYIIKNLTTNKDIAKTESDYVLKSYVQYSARYTKNDNPSKKIDVTINYTLDNYLNIIGTIGDVYYTKTGYLIRDDLVTSYSIDGTPYSIDKLNENVVKDKILGTKTNSQTINVANTATVNLNNGIEIKANINAIKSRMPGVEINTIEDAENYIKQHPNAVDNEVIYEIQKYKAIAYYASSAAFSNWVYTNLGDLKSSNIIDKAMTGYYTGDEGNLQYVSTSGVETGDLYYNFSENPMKIFVKSTEGLEHYDPEDKESNFNTHKMEVIKNSIKYNLNLAMSAYNKMEKVNKVHDYEASMPVLLDEEWDKILSNISIVSFMQGWECGLDIYNNYQIVSSTNNELTVTPSEIYYVEKSKFNTENDSYHRLDCNELTDTDLISFKSKEVKYDKVSNKSDSSKYIYDHKNLACYTCINSINYNSYFNNPQYKSFYNIIDNLSLAKKTAGYIAIAKERQNIYKLNALPVSEGYRVFNKPDLLNGVNINWNDIAKIQVTVSNTKCVDSNGVRQPVLNLRCSIGTGSGNGTKDFSVNGNQDLPFTAEIDVSDITATSGNVSIFSNMSGMTPSFTVESIKLIYK